MPTEKDCFTSSVTTKNETVEEEVWLNDEGINIFDETMAPKLRVRNLHLQNHSIMYKSYSENEMTPLDMYNSLDKPQDYFIQQGSCDGTGTLVWLASKALAWSFDQDVQGMFSKYVSNENNNPMERKIICELGCGTGLSGLATLLLTNHNDSKGSDNLVRNLKVLFTDNDMESLDNCRDNCELNGIPSDRYCHERLSWGMSDTYPSNCVGAVDVVLAADVLYEMKMIAPLLRTAYDLLRPNSNSGNVVIDQQQGSSCALDRGYLILSHVPRFCLSREDHEHDDRNGEPSDPDQSCRIQRPFQLLEQHLVELAISCGFVLKTMFRPHLVLQTIDEDQQSQKNHSRDSSVFSTRSEAMSVHDYDLLNHDLLVQLMTANACIFVFQKCYQ